MKHINRQKRQELLRGVTLVELLVVLLIITLISTAAVPVFINRVEDARRATAAQEVAEIAKAEILCAIDHSVYVPLQLLDDLPQDTGATASGRDDIQNSSLGSNLIILTTVPVEDQDSSDQIALGDSNSPVAVNLINNWRGPFLNPQRVWTNGKANEAVDLTDLEARLDYPLDPYGNPYRFYSPQGVIGGGSLTVTGNDATAYNSNSFSNGNLSTYDDRFDRFAIVSYGSDGLSQSTTGGGLVNDDIVYLFGLNPVETTFSGSVLP